MVNPRSPGTHIVGPWVIDSINFYRDLRTGAQYIGIWASRVRCRFRITASQPCWAGHGLPDESKGSCCNARGLLPGFRIFPR